MDVRGVGAYIRDQRRRSRLTLEKLSGSAGVSIPYLSQVERGLRRPSAEILQAIAKGLRISAETLYVRAGILEDRPPADVVTAVMADPAITERQKQALVQIYEAFRDEAGRTSPQAPSRPSGARARGPRAPRPRTTTARR
jgi:transcriptional regulator with XRE-family HTH domain